MLFREIKNKFTFVLFLSLLLVISSLTAVAAEKNNNIFGSSGETVTTGFEDRNGEGWTTHAEELDFLEEVATQSERMSYSEIGTSAEGRPLHLVRVGFPEPPTDEEIAAGNNILVMGTPHGNEPAGREMALQYLRDLAFTDDPVLLDQLSEVTILFVPSQNPDGSEGNYRYTSEGKDMNQDRVYLDTPEAKAVASVYNQFNPDVLVSTHERGSSSPEIAMFWPSNLNVDSQLYELNKEMVEDYVWPDVRDAGYSTGRYNGIGAEWNLRNMAGLQHTIAVLTESGRNLDPNDRVDMQKETAISVLRFYRERFDDVQETVTGSADRKTDAGANQSEPFYLEGDIDSIPPESGVLDPPPCGYLLHTMQAERMSEHIELFSLETEQVSENGVFITMAQPMMTVVPLLLDEDAHNNVVDGLALYDCSDPGSVEPPIPPELADPEQYETDFSRNATGEQPNDWSPLWRDSDWTVFDEPSRLEHNVTTGGGRRALTWNKVGNVRDDVEVSGLVRASGSGTTMLQIHLHASAPHGNEHSYYLDLRDTDYVRINRYLNGAHSTLESSELSFTVEEFTWYNVVFQREDEVLRGKVWPYGEEEPDEWQVTAEDRFINDGQVGVGHLTSGMVNEWAFFSVGTGSDPAPRASEDLIPEIDKSLLQRRVNEIHDMNLDESNYTEESWQLLQEALSSAENVLNNPEAAQPEINGALTDLNEAFSDLETPSMQYETDFSNYAVGSTPEDWSSLWRESNWTILDEPRRLEHRSTGDQGARRALTWDKVGDVRGDVEVSAVVRARDPGLSKFQLGFHMNGAEDNTDLYYLDVFQSGSNYQVRLNRYSGSFSVLGTSNLPFTVEEDSWYQTVVQREGDMIRAKVWPFGEDEPSEWQVEVTDSSYQQGKVGLVHLTDGVVNDWAFVGVGTGSETAPRAPEDLFEPEVDKTELQDRVDEINAESLNEDDYTEESWQTLQDALETAENVLNDLDATQTDVHVALEELNDARDGLEYADTPVISAENMITSIESFAEEGAFESDSIVRSLTMHLTAVSHYEGQEQGNKVVRHMEGFKLILDYQQENKLVSDEAYNALYAEAESLIEKWQ